MNKGPAMSAFYKIEARVTFCTSVAVLFFGVVLSLPSAFAQSGSSSLDFSDTSDLRYNVNLERTESRFNLGIYTQGTQFTLEGRTLTGAAIETLAGYALNEKLSLNLNLMQAVSTTGGIAVLYTGIRTAMSYAIIGQAYRLGSNLSVNNQSSVTSEFGRDSTLSAGVGVDQIFFNGQTRVTPATGASVEARYDHQLWILRLSWMARFGTLVVGDTSLNMMTAGAGVLFRF